MTNQTSIVLAAVAAGLAGYMAGGAMTAGVFAHQGQAQPTMTPTALDSETRSQSGNDRYEPKSRPERPAVLLTSRSRFMD